MEGKVLIVNNGSTSTKIALYVSEEKVLEEKIFLPAEMASKYKTILDHREDSKDAILSYLRGKNVDISSIDLIIARGGLVMPVESGAYAVNEAMIRELKLGNNGVHACNLSAIIADDIAQEINALRKEKGLSQTCAAYIADPPLADDLLPEYKLSGRPELTRRSVFHALNSRAVVRAYAKSVGKTSEDVVAIVAHIGGGSSVSVHSHGKVIDVNDSLGGDGPISVERAGTVPAFPIIDICFSGKYTKEEVQKMLVGNGGAMSYFGTKDILDLVNRAKAGDKAVDLFIKAYCSSVAKYIGYFSTVVCGEMDAIIITGGVAYNDYITDEIKRRVSFIAPVVIYPGEDEIPSLAYYGYGILAGTVEVKTYVPETDTTDYYEELNYVCGTESGTESEIDSETVKEGRPGRQLKDVLRDQLRRLPRLGGSRSSSSANAGSSDNSGENSGRLWRILRPGYRGEPLWRLFRKDADGPDKK